MLRLSGYLRWIASLARRLSSDAQNHLSLQEWWAQGVAVAPSAMITCGPKSLLEIGSDSIIGPYTILDLRNDPLAHDAIASVLKIGRHTSIGEFNNLRASGGEITIGDDCLTGQYVSIIASNHSLARGISMSDQPWDTRRTGVTIGDDVWIGTHATILPGVTIGSGCVIGAGAVVSSNIPEYAVAAGVPAKIIRQR